MVVPPRWLSPHRFINKTRIPKTEEPRRHLECIDTHVKKQQSCPSSPKKSPLWAESDDDLMVFTPYRVLSSKALCFQWCCSYI